MSLNLHFCAYLRLIQERIEFSLKYDFLIWNTQDMLCQFTIIIFSIAIQKSFIMQQQPTQLCIRLKRDKTTFFMTCKQYQQIDSIKMQLLKFFNGLQPSDLRLYIGNRLLDDKSNVHDQDIQNYSLIYFKLKKGNGGQWQEIPEIGV